MSNIIDDSKKDQISKVEHEMHTQKIHIDELQMNRQNDIAKAHAEYEMALQHAEIVFKKDIVDLEQLKFKAEEKRKKLIADAKVHLLHTLDKIEDKY